MSFCREIGKLTLFLCLLTTATFAGEMEDRLFTRDKSNPKLGDARRDPRGMIWGDIVTNDDGSPYFMNHKDATDYCKNSNAKLPSREDFLRLREYMAATSEGSEENYQLDQIIPHLIFFKNGQPYGRYIWSSSIVPENPDSAYGFNGYGGDIGTLHRTYANCPFRCVVQALQ